MGEIAEGLINGDFDSITGEYIGEGFGFPRTYSDRDPRDVEKYSKSTRQIRRELAILIKEKQSHCNTEKEKNHAVNIARKEINIKYGKGWREQL